MNIGMRIEIRDGNEPTVPTAKRGAFFQGLVRTTDEQSEKGLTWWPCAFCGGNVLVDVYRNTRERCACGARRCHHTDTRRGIYEEGWRLNGHTLWYC
jgi:hypothetical protein